MTFPVETFQMISTDKRKDPPAILSKEYRTGKAFELISIDCFVTFVKTNTGT